MSMGALQNETAARGLLPPEVTRVLTGIGSDEENPELEEILELAYSALAAVDAASEALQEPDETMAMVTKSRQLLERIFEVFGPVTIEPMTDDFAHQFEVDFELRHNQCASHDNVVDLYDPMMVLVHGGCELLRAALGMLAGRLEHGMLGGQDIPMHVELAGALYGVRRSLERSLVLLLEFLPIMRSPHELVPGWRSSLGDLLLLSSALEERAPAEALEWLRAEVCTGALMPVTHRDVMNSRDIEPAVLVSLVRRELDSNPLLVAYQGVS